MKTIKVYRDRKFWRVVKQTDYTFYYVGFLTIRIMTKGYCKHNKKMMEEIEDFKKSLKN